MVNKDIYQHLLDRHFNINLYNSITISEDTLTVPLWNLSGQFVGYQQYNPKGTKTLQNNPKEGKYYTYITKQGKTSYLTAWGLDLLNKDDKVIYLLEGVFKACRLHNKGYNALAVICNDPKHLRTWLNCLGYRIIPICDGDKAGSKLAKFGSDAIILPEGVYIDDMSNLEFEKFIKTL